MKILFIACYSPFINNSASIETLMYLNNFAKKNKVYLITVDFPKDSIYYDGSVLSLLDKNIIIYKIGVGKVFERLMPKKSDVNNLNMSKGIYLLKKIKNKVIFPDIYYYWSLRASKFAKTLMEKEKLDLIFSMHEPPSSHLCALKIKKSFKNIPWILYWSDPWVKDISRENIGLIRKYIEKSQEKAVTKLGDKHIFVTTKNKEYFKSTYSLDEKNIFIINRGYNEDLYKKIGEENKPKFLVKDKINIVYTGEIIEKIRDIKPFIEGLKILRDNNSKLFYKLNILFFGNIDSLEIKNELKSMPNINLNKRIDFKEALKYIVHSDILLVLGNKTSMQIPAKIYDYLGGTSPILVIKGNQYDKIEDLTKSIEKCFITENISYEIINELEKIINTINKGIKFKAEEKYNLNNTWKKLNCIFKFYKE